MRRAILGHANGDITTHYSAAEVAELIAAVSKIEGGESAPVMTLIRASDMGQNRGTKKQAADQAAVSSCVIGAPGRIRTQTLKSLCHPGLAATTTALSV